MVKRGGGLALMLVMLVSGTATAQSTEWLPDVRQFRSPLADPMAPRIAAALLNTDLLATQGPERPPFELHDAADAAREVVAAVGIGVVFPLAQVVTWPDGGVQLVMDGRVFARFRIEKQARDDLGQDWWVGGGAELGRGRWSGRAMLMHRSSHLGDEFMESTGATRIEFGGEQIDLMVAYDVPRIARVYAGGSWVFRSYLNWEQRLRELGMTDRAVLQFGMDREWRPSRDPRVVIHAGVDVHTAERTEWSTNIAAAAGIGLRTSRALRLTLRGYDGTSMMGEFFLTRERYIALEVSAEL